MCQSTGMTGADWVQLVVGVLAFVAALGSAIAAVKAAANAKAAAEGTAKASARDEWWRRTQWAIGMALSEKEKSAEVGVLALAELTNSPLADEEADLPIATAALASILPSQPNP